MKKLSVLALLTNRKSNNVQITSVANALSGERDFYKKHIYFNSIIKLPNFLLSLFPVWLTVNKNDGFNDIENCDVIVTCGRRSARYAKHIKNKIFKNAKIVQILKPDYFTKGIDLIMLPEHDRSFLKKKNIIRFKGALCEQISQNVLQEEAAKFSKINNMFKGPFIGVYIGGSSRHFHFSPALIEEFARRINQVAKDACLLITTSRRTDSQVVKILKEHLTCSYYLYDYKNKDQESGNPYHAFMHLANFNIVTGDSISMISEILSTGKPLYIFTEGIKSRKYQLFHNDLIIRECAKELKRDTLALEDFKPHPLNDLEKISNDIVKMLDISKL
jgi:mitochondrial fission protein ELM1